MKKFLAVLLSAAMVPSLAACGGKKDDAKETTKAAATETTKADAGETTADADVETVKIGLLVAASGSYTQMGIETKALAEIITDLVNNKHEGIHWPLAEEEGLPNLGGAKIEFVIGDLSTAEIAQTEAERLITEEDVVAICGNFSSGPTKTAMVACEKYGVPLLSPGTSATLPEAGYKYYGRVFPGDDVFIEDTFDYLDYLNAEKDAGIKTVCLVSEDSEFGANIGAVEKAAAERHGYEIAGEISYSATATNVTSEVMRIKDINADVVMMSSYANDALLFMSEYKTQNYFPKILFGQRGGFTTTDFANLGDDADYVMTTARWNIDVVNDASKDITELWNAEQDIPINGDALSAIWEATVLICAINQAGSTDGDAIRQAMADGIQIDKEDDPFGLDSYKFAENGPNEGAKGIIAQYMGGTMHTIYPESMAAQAAAYPAVVWSER